MTESKVGQLNTRRSRPLLPAAFLIAMLLALPIHRPFAEAATAVPETEQLALARNFNRWAAGLRTVRAGGKARVGGEHEKTRAFQFSLVLARPGTARVQGRWGSLATLFDLGGSAEGWTLYIPQERTVVRSRESGANAALLLPPSEEILSILLPAGIPPRDLTGRGAVTREGEELRMVVPPGTGNAGSRFHRVMWLDEKEQLRRLEVREKSQLEVPLLVAEYRDYEGKGAKAFPVEVHVDMIEAGQWAEFSFETVKINGDVTPALFQVNVPAGTREIQPEDLNPDFLPEAEEEP